MSYPALIGQYASDVLLVLVKVAYPTYASFKAIRSKEGKDDTTWLIYWVVLAVFSFIESYIIPFVSWIPFFMLLRLLSYIWFQLPFFNGSVLLFRKYIMPFFQKNEKIMESVTISDSKDLQSTLNDMSLSLNQVYLRILNSLE